MGPKTEPLPDVLDVPEPGTCAVCGADGVVHFEPVPRCVDHARRTVVEYLPATTLDEAQPRP